jgi:hypothetical protein
MKNRLAEHALRVGYLTMFYQQELLLMLVYEPFCLIVSGIDVALLRLRAANMTRWTRSVSLEGLGRKWSWDFSRIYPSVRVEGQGDIEQS